MPTSRFDRFSSLASQWAQVFTLVLVTFGYFYTVRPVYQKDVLEEESARLKLENGKTKRDVLAAQKRVASIRKEMAVLEQDKKSLLTSSQAIQNENRALSFQKIGLQQAADLAAAKLTKFEQLSDTQIEEAQTTLLSNGFSLYFWNEIDRTERPFIGDEPGKLEKWASETPKQPGALVLARIDKELREKTYFRLPEPHAVSQRVIEKIRMGVVKHMADLTCPMIDRKQWLKAWESASVVYAKSVDDCVNFHVDHTAATEGWTSGQVASWRKGTQGRASTGMYRGLCEVSAEYHQARLFHDRQSAVDRVCSIRLIRADDIALGNTDKLEPFPPVTPPAPVYDWYKDWYKKE